MDYKAALAAVRGTDNGAELASAIESHVSGLEEKNFAVIGEKRTETQKRQAMQSALEGIGKSLGIEGGVDEVLANAQGKIQTVVGERDAATTKTADLEKRAAEAETKITGFERKQKFAEVATKSGANAAVLEKLFAEKPDDLVIADDGTVKVGDKTLKEHVEGDESLKLFASSLFPDGETLPPKKKPKLPGGPPSDGAGDKGTNPLDNYLARNRTGAKALTATTK
ncbi:MAG: hypothetical protein AAGI45_13465 [Cyanobacteria bacterium P01_H01_bin.26]